MTATQAFTRPARGMVVDDHPVVRDGVALRLPDGPVPPVVTGLLQRCDGVTVVVFTAHGERHAVRAALDAGAHGCQLKDPGPAEPGPGLTRREVDVLRHRADPRHRHDLPGDRDAEAGARNRVEAISTAGERGLL